MAWAWSTYLTLAGGTSEAALVKDSFHGYYKDSDVQTHLGACVPKEYSSAQYQTPVSGACEFPGTMLYGDEYEMISALKATYYNIHVIVNVLISEYMH